MNVFNGGYGSAIDKPEGGNTDFYSLSDRGPNVGGTGNDKLFAVPGVSNDDDFGVSDDGKGHLIQKFLPNGQIDHNELWLFHLSRSVKSIH